MTHIITTSPEFDQVLTVDRALAVDAVNTVSSDEELSSNGVCVTFPGKENNSTMRFEEGEIAHGERFRRNISEAKLEINIGKEIYFEENGLSAFYNPCQGANIKGKSPKSLSSFSIRLICKSIFWNHLRLEQILTKK